MGRTLSWIEFAGDAQCWLEQSQLQVAYRFTTGAFVGCYQRVIVI
jgi:hypothetical protein